MAEEGLLANGVYEVVEVHSITNTSEPGCLTFDITLSYPMGEVVRAGYTFRTSDQYGASPVIWQWLLDNPSFPIAPYVPPTSEETRALMSPLQRLDFKTRFKNAGMGLVKVNAYLTSLEEDESHWEDMYNYWNETPTFTRLSPFVVELAEFSLKTPEDIDTIWTA